MSPERITPGSGEDPDLLAQHVARYEFAGGYVEGKTVLDIACGSGYGSAILRTAGARNVVGIDIDPQAVRYAQERYAAEGIEFRVGNAETSGVQSEFDVIVSFETIEHLRNPEGFLRETTRLLSAGGMLIISTPEREHGTMETTPSNPFHMQEWSGEEFEALLKKHYRTVSLFGQYFFPKKWYPFSRTIQRKMFRARFPSAAGRVERFPVVPGPHDFRGFDAARVYVVALCTQGIVK